MPSGGLNDLVHTLRFRVMAWLVVVVFVMVLVTMAAVRQLVWPRLQHDFDQVLVEDTVEIGLAIKQLYPDKRDQLLLALERLVLGHEYRAWFVELYDADRQLLWASRTTPALPAPKFEARRTPFDLDSYRVIEDRVPAARAGGVIYVRSGCSRQPLEEDIALLNRVLALVSLLLLLLAPLGGFVLAGRATRPIAWIIDTTARLQPDNLDERLPVRGTGDELDLLSRTINGMLDRLASYIQGNRTFVANAAHELRSPLAAIRSSVEVGLNRNRSPEEYAALLTDVMEECSRLGSLVNRLLLLAEGDAGRLAARDQAVQLDKIVRESVEMFDAVAESQGVQLTTGDLTPALVPGDEYYLRQVVRNLIDNAIKFSPPPGEVTVSLRVEAARREAVLSVTDRGVGIPPESLPHVFERFYRADKARHRAARGGHGLGLSICQVIVNALHGTIRVESKLGEGSTFTVRLPLVDAGAGPPGLPEKGAVQAGEPS